MKVYLKNEFIFEDARDGIWMGVQPVRGRTDRTGQASSHGFVAREEKGREWEGNERGLLAVPGLEMTSCRIIVLLNNEVKYCGVEYFVE